MLGHAKDVHICFVDLEKSCDRVPREKRWRVLRECGVDGRLLLAVKSPYSCSKIRAIVGKVKSRPFTVRVELRHGCAPSTLLFIVSTT